MANYDETIVLMYLLAWFVCWSSTQPCWYIISFWPHSDSTPLSHSMTCTFLASPFFHIRDLFGIGLVLINYF